jgi:hypothetical protein
VTQSTSKPTGSWRSRRGPRTYIGLVICAAVVPIVAALAVVRSAPAGPARPHSTERYLGLYEPGVPASYAGINQFAKAIGMQPNIVSYYNVWLGRFETSFATTALDHGAITLVQLGTGKASMSSIAKGQYDTYWRSYADEVKSFGAQVVLSFGHEMNGDWYPFGYKHTSPAAFVAAWRHVVNVFREQGVKNVTWLWTVNIVYPGEAAAPGPWWPGSSYVNWVGIDGYYYSWSETFADLFGSTIADVREITHDPILIAETSAALSAGQPEKIADLFNGVQTFGLLGFLWFNQNGSHKYLQSWRIGSPAAFAALRQGVKTYMKPTPLKRS